MKKSQTYPSQVYWDERDQGFIALAPDLPGCSAFGETKTKALKELEHAIEGWIESALSAAEPVPEPSKLPEPSNFSGKILLRVAKSLHEKLAQQALIEGISLNQWMVTLLSSGSQLLEPKFSSGALVSISHTPQNAAWLLALPANKPIVASELRNLNSIQYFTPREVVTILNTQSPSYFSVDNLENIQVVENLQITSAANLKEIKHG